MKLRRVLPLGLILVLVLSFVGAARADNSNRETWAVVEQDGKPVGFGVDQYSKTPDGHRCVSDLAMKLSMLGGKEVRVTQHIEQNVDAHFQFRSMSLSTDVGGTRTLIQAGVAGGDVRVVTTTADGKEHVQTWPKPSELYLESFFVDSILAREGLHTGRTYRATILNIATWSPGTLEVTIGKESVFQYRGRPVAVFEVTSKTPAGVTRTLMDSQGESFWAEAPALRMTIRKAERNEIPEIQSFAADVLIIPGNIKVTHPYRSVFSRIRVTWEDVPFNLFQLNDNRQQLVRHTQTGERHEAWVDIRHDERDFTGRVTLPVAMDNLRPYLLDTRNITPSLPETRRLALAITAGETDGWRAAQKLCEGVFRYIEGAYIPETLTTAQIIQRKEGKCVEYAVLFAALARSIGLPTRVVLGERYQDNMWIGHMWNEVWVGEWVAVDASHNQLAPDALLVKFAHGDDIPAVQEVRSGLTGRLGIMIEEVKTRESQESAEKLVTGVSGRSYTHADYRCQITVPEGWTVTEASEQGVPMAVMQLPGTPSVQAVMLMFSVPPGTAAGQILDARIPSLQGALPGFEFINREIRPVGSKIAAVGTWTFVQGMKYRQQNWIIVHGDTGFLFVFVAPDAKWSQYEGDFDAILESLRLL